MSELPELPTEMNYGATTYFRLRAHAVEARIRKLAGYSWHNDPCDWLGDNTLACTCGHDELRAKLQAEGLIP